MVTTCFRKKDKKKIRNMVWSFVASRKNLTFLFKKKKLSYLNDSPDKTLLF